MTTVKKLWLYLLALSLMTMATWGVIVCSRSYKISQNFVFIAGAYKFIYRNTHLTSIVSFFNINIMRPTLNGYH